MRPGISLIVVNYRTPALLRGFLDSLKDYPPIEDWDLTIVNVDPNPEDEDVGLAYAYPPFNYLPIYNNVGYGNAVNWAVKSYEHRETLALFNADTKLTKNVASKCHELLQSNTEYGIVGPRQVNSKGFITHAGFFPQERGFRQQDRGQYQDIRDDATTVSGSAYFIKRTVWDELTSCCLNYNGGAFLPTPMYYEETYCSFHARLHGYKVVYDGAVTMIHEWNKSPDSENKHQLQQSKRMFEEALATHAYQIN